MVLLLLAMDVTEAVSALLQKARKCQRSTFKFTVRDVVVWDHVRFQVDNVRTIILQFESFYSKQSKLNAERRTLNVDMRNCVSKREIWTRSRSVSTRAYRVDLDWEFTHGLLAHYPIPLPHIKYTNIHTLVTVQETTTAG